MKMGVFGRRSYGDPFEPVTLIEAYQARAGPVWSIMRTFLRPRILWRSMGVICGTGFSITSVARI
jgi:hypothetical protein